MKEYARIALTKDRIREAMDVAGKSQADLARETGLSRGTISRYLSGEVEPRQDATYKLAATLGVSEMWLWGYDVPKERTVSQKKNDDLVQVIARLRKDADFYETVVALNGLTAEQLASLKVFLSLGKK